MELEYLKNFMEIVRSKSISAAAKKLQIAQSALSYQLKALETHYGAPLVIRGPRQIALTPAGGALYENAKRIILLENKTASYIEDSLSGGSGSLWYAVPAAYPDQLLDPLLNAFHDAYPNIRYQSFERESTEVANLLIDGAVEVGIFRMFENISSTIRSELDVHFYIKEKLTLFYRDENPWFQPNLDHVPISALKGVPLSISKAFKERLTYACLKEGFSPDYMSVCSTRVAARRWAYDGTAVAIHSCSVIPKEDGYHYCILDGEDASMRLIFATLSDQQLSPTSALFLDFAKKYLQNHHEVILRY